MSKLINPGYYSNDEKERLSPNDTISYVFVAAYNRSMVAV